MFSVLRVRSYSQCPSIYDNFGDKVLVHSQSSLAQTLTKQIEDQKKKLADRVTQEVFAEFDLRWNSRAEINRVIKKRLKEQFLKESLNTMVEIIDLEANFIRAPTVMIVDKVIKQVYQYIKHCTEKSMVAQRELACLRNKRNVDNLPSPFDLTDRYLKVLSLLNSSIEIQRFMSHKNTSVKQIASFLGKHKIFN